MMFPKNVRKEERSVEVVDTMSWWDSHDKLRNQTIVLQEPILLYTYYLKEIYFQLGGESQMSETE